MFTLEQLSDLKRKDLISLCKEHEIKCVGKNAELIEKLLELNKESNDQAQPAPAEPIDLVSEQLAAEILVGTDLNQVESMEETIAETQPAEEVVKASKDHPTELEHIPVVDESTATLDNTVEPKAAEEVPQTAELNDEVVTVVEPVVPERRMSARLSIAHLKKAMTPQKSTAPKTPSTLRNSCGKENAKPKLFNKNISHIPTLKERVSMLASKPVVAKRPKPEVSLKAVKKPKFDLKESLSRPLSYKPYTGGIKKTLP